MFVLGLFACGQAPYLERLDAYRAAMAPVLEEAKALDIATWSYDDGTAGYGQGYTFVAVSRPEHAVLARWTGAASPGFQKLIKSNRDEVGCYTDWARVLTRQQLLGVLGQTEMGAASEVLKAALAPVVDAVKALEPTGEPVLGAIPAGRKVLVTTNGYAHDVSFHPPPWAALDAASVGIVASVERVPDETPSGVFDDGVPGYGATFTITVRTWPDQTIVRRWSEHRDPPSSVLDAKRTRVDAYYNLNDLGAAVYAGRDTAPVAAP